MSSADPAMSVVLVAAERYDTLRRTMSYLRRQTIAEELEIIVASPKPEGIVVDVEDQNTFHSVRVIRAPGGEMMSATRAAGIRTATAPYVALSEDHTCPAPEWAEALLARHRQGYAVVGPLMCNANPGTVVSWASFLLAYAPWVEREDACEMNVVAGHNTSYRRDLMMDYGDELDLLLGAEGIIHRELREKGHKVFFEPRAQTSHINMSCTWPYLLGFFHHGRLFGSMQARRWWWPKRLLWTAASPAVPLLRVARLVRTIRERFAGRLSVWRMLPMIVLGAVASWMGEVFGTLSGTGGSVTHDWQHELDRDRLLSPADKQNPRIIGLAPEPQK